MNGKDARQSEAAIFIWDNDGFWKQGAAYDLTVKTVWYVNESLNTREEVKFT
jgi:hypothetical protein